MKPKVFISSTIYDFRDLRSSLKFHFEKYGYDVQLSEFNDFKKDLDMNSYQACLDSIKQSDYFILLIGSRVGGFYDKKNNISITKKEYQTAFEMAELKKLKLIVFVRDEIWKVKEDRQSLEELLRSDVALQKEIEENDVEKITHHPSSLINDSNYIFSFINEVSRKEDMKKAIDGDAELPKHNWVHRFNNFADIIDVVNVEFHLTTSIEEIALRHNLTTELLANIQSMLIKHGAIIEKTNSWGEFGRKSLSSSIDLPSTMKFKYFKWFLIYSLIGPGMRHSLRSYFIEKAISSGFFLKYNNSDNSYGETDFSKYLNILRKRISDLIRFDKLASENSFKLKQKYPLPKNTPDDKLIIVDNMDIIPFLILYDCEEDVINISKALINYLKNDELEVFENFSFSPITPFKDENEKIKKEKPTFDETMNWINKETD